LNRILLLSCFIVISFSHAAKKNCRESLGVEHFSAFMDKGGASVEASSRGTYRVALRIEPEMNNFEAMEFGVLGLGSSTQNPYNYAYAEIAKFLSGKGEVTFLSSPKSPEPMHLVPVDPLFPEESSGGLISTNITHQMPGLHDNQNIGGALKKSVPIDEVWVDVVDLDRFMLLLNQDYIISVRPLD
jgi:hypothetical protein